VPVLAVGTVPDLFAREVVKLCQQAFDRHRPAVQLALKHHGAAAAVAEDGCADLPVPDRAVSLKARRCMQGPVRHSEQIGFSSSGGNAKTRPCHKPRLERCHGRAPAVIAFGAVRCGVDARRRGLWMES
jgi:hypothetical protein